MSYNLKYLDACALEEFTAASSKSYLCQRKLGFREIDEATYLPIVTLPGDRMRGGVLDGDGAFVPNTGFHVGKEGKYEMDQPVTRRIDTPAVYLGYFNPVWGHCITDNLKLLWFVLTDDFRQLREGGGVRLVYGCDKSFRFSRNFSELLSMAGVEVGDLERVDEPTQFAKLYVPEACFVAGDNDERYYYGEYVDLINRICSAVVPDSSYDKVYFTRTRLSASLRDYGERDIERTFARLGYKIIAPERLSLRKQLAILQGCKAFATTEGSVSHNAEFLSEGAELVVVRKVDFINHYQLCINEMKQLNTTYVDAHLSVFADVDYPAAGPFFLYVNDNMQRFSKDCGVVAKNSFSIGRFKKYLNTCLLLPNFDRRVLFHSYYYAKLSREIETKKQGYRQLLNRLPFVDDEVKEKIKTMAKKILAQ